MNKKAVNVAIFLMVVSVTILVSQAAVAPYNKSGALSVKTVSSRAYANGSRRIKSPNPPTPPISQIGFHSAPQVPAGGGTYSSFDPVQGDFDGDGNTDVATIVNTGTGKAPVFAISVVLGNGDGTFKPAVLTPTLTTEFDPIFVGDVDGDGKSDIVLIHQAAPATAQVWLSNGDGTFTGGTPLALTNPATISVLWGGLATFSPTSTGLDIVAVDGLSPSGNVWVLKNNGTGTFAAPLQVPFSGQMNPGPPAPTIVFGDFNHDGYMDFAGPAGPGSIGSVNQMVVYTSSTSSTYPNPPQVLDTPNHAYQSCYNTSGNLSGHANAPDLLSANCFDNTVTVYKNDGAGNFDQSTHNTTNSYYIAGTVPGALSIADMNGDGFNDIVSTNVRAGDVTVLLNDGTGAFPSTGPSTGYAIGGEPSTAAMVADFNKDGHNDVMVQDGVYDFTYFKGVGDGSFLAALNYYSQPTPSGLGYQSSYGIATADFNGDGIPDFVIGNGYCCLKTAGNVTVFISDGHGGVLPGVNYGSATQATFAFQYVALGDFNGDGILDIAATDAINGGVQIFDGKGDGTFTAGPVFPSDTVAASTLGIIAGEFNGDGKTDLAVVNVTASGTKGDVGILINNGASGFKTPVTYPLSAPAINITAADLGNKETDLLIPIYGTTATAGSSIALLIGKGDGTFSAGTPYSLTIPNTSTVFHNPRSVAVGYVNSDGIPDLAITVDDQVTIANQGLVVAPGTGVGTFGTPVWYASTLQSSRSDLPYPGDIKITDVNRDGVQDLVYTNSKFSTAAVMYGKGDGTFFDPREFPSGGLALSFAYADINGDGTPDIITTGNAATFSGVTVLLNTGGVHVTLKSSPNPSMFKSAVTYTSTVTSAGTGAPGLPTGSVNFYDGTTLLGSGTLSAGGTATLTTTATAAGSRNITAQYSGDVNFVPTVSPTLVQVVNAPPGYALSANPTTQTVTAGSSATYTVTLTPHGGYNGTVTFGCVAPLPAGVTCAYNPATLTPTNGNAITTTLTVTTTAPTSAVLKAPAGMGTHSDGLNLWAGLSSVGLFGLVVSGEWKKRNRSRMVIMFALLALLLIGGLVGCGGSSSSGGGGGGGGGTGGTPTGSHTINVSAPGTAGTNGGGTSPDAPLSVTLVVQ